MAPVARAGHGEVPPGPGFMRLRPAIEAGRAVGAVRLPLLRLPLPVGALLRFGIPAGAVVPVRAWELGRVRDRLPPRAVEPRRARHIAPKQAGLRAREARLAVDARALVLPAGGVEHRANGAHVRHTGPRRAVVPGDALRSAEARVCPRRQTSGRHLVYRYRAINGLVRPPRRPASRVVRRGALRPTGAVVPLVAREAVEHL